MKNEEKHTKGFSFSRWWAIVLKEFIQLKRDRPTLGMIVGIPIMQLFLFGYAINTDPKHLPIAIVSTCQATNTIPQHDTAQYNDYTSVNPTLDGLIDQAKRTLNVRLPGDPLPAVSHLEDLIATWDLATFREKAWDTAQSLWGEPGAEINLRMDLRDAIVASLSSALLVPAP